MTTLGGTGYDNLLVATNDNGLIDYSFIDMTTSKSGNKLVQTLDSGLININLLPTSTTGANNKIPITTSGNVLSNTWLNTTNGTGTLAAGKVVVTGSDKLISNNLLNTTDGSTTTESANSSKIVKTTTNGKINDNLLKTTKSGGSANANTIVKLDSNGLLDPSLFRNDQFIPLTGGEPSGNILVIRPGDSANKTLEDLKSKYPNFYGFGSSSYTDGFLMGMNGTSNSDNYLVIATLDDGNEPIYVRQYAGSQGYLNMPNNKVNEITLMDKDGYTIVNKLTSSGDIVTTDAKKTSGNLTIAGIGESSIAGTLKVAKGITIPVTSDKVVPTNSTDVPLLIGSASGVHLEIDHNEIQAKYNATTPSGVGTASQGDVNGSQLVLQADGGLVTVGNHYKTNFTVNGNISTTNNGDEYKVNNVGNKEASKGNLTIAGTSYLKNTEVGNSSTKSDLKVYGTGYFYNTNDASGTANNKPALIIGGTDTTTHIEIDNNEIQAKASGTTTGTLGINIDGGNVSIGNDAANSVVTLRKNTSVTGTLNIAGLTTVGSTTKTANLVVNGTGDFTNTLTAENGINVTSGCIDIHPDYSTAKTSGTVCHIMGHMAGSDDWRIAGGATASDAGFVEIAVADNGNENIYVRKYIRNASTNEHFYSVSKELTLLDTNGDTILPGRLKFSVPGYPANNIYDNPAEPIRIKYMNTAGNSVFFGGKGITVLGGGEGAYELYDYLYNTDTRDNGSSPNRYPDSNKLSPIFNPDGDSLTLTSDSHIYIHTNVQANYNNRHSWGFFNDGTFRAIHLKITRGTAPSSYSELAIGDFRDSANNRTGLISNVYTTDKSSETRMYAYKTTTASGGNIGRLGIGCNSSGNIYTVAPTPATNSNDTNIATTAWVKSQGYATSSSVSTAISGIDLSSRAPMPTTSSGVGQIVSYGPSQTFTPPAGGTWEVWGDIHNSNSTSNGAIYKIVAGGTEIDAGWFQTRVNWFAKRIK